MKNGRENNRKEREPEEVRRKSGTTRIAGRRRPAARSRKQQDPLKAAILLTVIAILLVALVQLVPRGGAGRPDSDAGISSRPPVPPEPVPESSPDRAPENRAPESGAQTGVSIGTETVVRETPERVAAAGRAVARRRADREAEPAPIAGSARIVLVIDDVGHNLRQLEPFLRFPDVITFAVLPGLPYTAASAQRIREEGKGLLLHQPMEAAGGSDPGPGAIYTSMSDVEVLQVLEANLDQLPGVQGVNNHMGSRATADSRIMRLILGSLGERDLLFLDSRTTADTRSVSVAREIDFEKILERTVFLDNQSDAAAIRRAFEEGLQQARTGGSTVMIGHVWTQELADILLDLYPSLIEDGYEFSDLTELLTDG